MHPAKFHIKLLALPFASSSSQWTAKLPRLKWWRDWQGQIISVCRSLDQQRWKPSDDHLAANLWNRRSFLPWWPSKAVGQFSTGHQLSSWAINVKCELSSECEYTLHLFLEVVDLSSNNPPNPSVDYSVVQTAPASKHPRPLDSKTSGIPKTQSSPNLHPPDNRIPLQPIVGPW